MSDTMQNQMGDGMLADEDRDQAQLEVDAGKSSEASHLVEVEMMPLGRILERTGPDTREPTKRALEALSLSIDALGLLEPLVVDRQGTLL